MNLVNNFMLLCLTLPWEISLMVRSADQLGLPKIQSFFFFFETQTRTAKTASHWTLNAWCYEASSSCSNEKTRFDLWVTSTEDKKVIVFILDFFIIWIVKTNLSNDRNKRECVHSLQNIASGKLDKFPTVLTL